MILIIDLCWKEDSLSAYEFVHPIKAIIENEGKQTAVRHHTGLSDADVEVAERIVACGTAVQDNAFRKHADALQKKGVFDKPFLGICAGMQVLGIAHSAGIVPSDEIGMGTAACRQKNKLFDQDLDAYMLHGHALEKLDRFDVLAENDECAQAVKHREKEAYGVLFHPEVRNEDIVRRFLQ